MQNFYIIVLKGKKSRMNNENMTDTSPEKLKHLSSAQLGENQLVSRRTLLENCLGC